MMVTITESTDFWKLVDEYTSRCNDEAFVNEIAYMMVTLHRTGA